MRFKPYTAEEYQQQQALMRQVSIDLASHGPSGTLAPSYADSRHSFWAKKTNTEANLNRLEPAKEVAEKNQCKPL